MEIVGFYPRIQQVKSITPCGLFLIN